MKYLLLLFTGIIFSSGIYAQFLKPLDKGFNETVVTSCFDTKGNYTAGYYVNADSVHFRQWNVFTKKWTILFKLKAANYGQYKCAYLRDTLYVSGLINDIHGLYKITQGNVLLKGVFKTIGLSSEVYDIKPFRDFLIVTGVFDSVYNGVNRIFSSRVAFFNGSGWIKSGFTSKTFVNDNIKAPLLDNIVVSNDTAVLGFSDHLFKYVHPNRWIKARTDLTAGISKIVLHSNNFVFSKYGKDSLFTFRDSANIKRTKIVTPLYYNSLFAHNNNLLYFDNERYLYRITGSNFSLLFYFNDSSRSNSISSFGKTSYINSSTRLLYKNVDYSKVAEIDLDSAITMGFDTVIGYVYWDKNKNLRRESQTDKPVPFPGIWNETYNTYVNAGNDGRFTDVVPDYNDCEYNLQFFQIDTCLRKTMTGLYRSTVKAPNVPRDTVFMPLHRTSLTLRNLKLDAVARVRQRLLDTAELLFSIYSQDCDYQISSGVLTVRLDTAFDFLSSTPAFKTKTANVLTYDLSNIVSYFPNNIRIKGIYSNTKFKIGDYGRHSARLTSNVSEDTSDNKDSIIQLMSYSYDPNAKHSYPEGKINSSVKKIRYHIDFQNLGNDDAWRVTIIDTLNLKMPVYEFQMLGASHPYKFSISGNNIIKWVFDNIKLRPKSVDEDGSKGYVVFDAKVRGDLRIGDSIRNKAYIYFDYNEAVITNFAVIRRNDNDNSIFEIHGAGGLQLYPNPAADFIKLANMNNEALEIVIYDCKGARISSINIVAGGNDIINTSLWSSGIYIARAANGAAITFIVE